MRLSFLEVFPTLIIKKGNEDSFNKHSFVYQDGIIDMYEFVRGRGSVSEIDIKLVSGEKIIYNLKQLDFEKQLDDSYEGKTFSTSLSVIEDTDTKEKFILVTKLFNDEISTMSLVEYKGVEYVRKIKYK